MKYNVIVLFAALACAGCSTIKNAPQTIGNGKWDGPVPPKAVWSVAESQYPWLSLVRPMVYPNEVADPFSGVAPSYTEWADANGQPVAFPITRTAIKSFTETLGATAPSKPVVSVSIPSNTNTAPAQPLTPEAILEAIGAGK